MLQTQFLGAGASGFYGPMSGLGYSPADITALQNALIKAGKTSVKANGVMDGRTAAAVYEIFRDKGGLFASALASIASASVASTILDAFKALQSMDATLHKVPGVSLDIPSLLRDTKYVQQIVSVVQGACSISSSIPGCSAALPVANTLQNALSTFNSKLSDAAPTLLKVIGILVPGSTPGAASTTTVKPLLINILPTSLLRPQAMQMSPPSPTVPGHAAAALPAGAIFKELESKTGQLPFYKKPLFWVAVAGGVAVVGGGSYFLLRKRRTA